MQTHAERSGKPPGPPSFISSVGVSNRKVDDIAVIDVSGPLTGEFAVDDFCDRVRGLLQEGVRRFAINLAEVQDIDNYGLGGLAAAYNWVQEAGGKVEFFSAPARVRRTLSKLRLDSVFAMFEDEQAALRAFGRSTNM